MWFFFIWCKCKEYNSELTLSWTQVSARLVALFMCAEKFAMDVGKTAFFFGQKERPLELKKKRVKM